MAYTYSPAGRDRFIAHIDMDCFFVSVGLRNKPHLRDKPIGVGLWWILTLFH